MSPFTMPGLTEEQTGSLVEVLQRRLAALLELQLLLKHAHWNVTGPNFIAVHEMLDPQVDEVRLMTDAIAERIATVGGAPVGTPQAITEATDAADRGEYPLHRGSARQHLAALDAVYRRTIEGQRDAIGEAADLDPVTEGLLTDQAQQLELYQWFVRSHLEATGDAPGFGYADRRPTADEEAKAEGHEVSPETAEAYQEMAEIGADAKGEGRVA